jgi:hypothetical protein
VQAVDQTVNDISGHELEIADLRQHGGIDEARAGNWAGLSHIAIRCSLFANREFVCRLPIAGCRHYIPDRGAGTASSSRSTRVSLVIPSDCAWKLISTRWRNTACAMARMSSKLT